MKNSRKIKKRFLASLGCAALGAVLAPAALAAEDLAVPAAGDPFRQYLPLIIGVTAACLVIAAVLLVSITAKKRKQSGEKSPAPDEDDSKNDGNQKGL